MQITAALVSLVLFVILLVCIIKKIEIKSTLFVLTMIAFAAAAILNGGDVVATGKSGAVWSDVFEQFKVSLAGTMAGTGLIILVVVAYSTYMGKIGASQALAKVLSIPLTKIKNKNVVLICAMIISFLLMMVLPSAMGTFVICLGVMLPSMIAAGINPLTVMTAFYVGCNVFAGPANPFVLMAINSMGIDMGVADFFVQYSLPVAFISVVIMGIVHSIWNLHLDKKEEPVTILEGSLPESTEVPCPKFYLLFPILPIVLLVVFSSLTGLGIVFSVVGGYCCALCIVFVIHVLCSKEKLAAYNGLSEFFDAMGPALTMPTVIVALSFFFGSGLTALGGINYVVGLIVDNLGLGFIPMLLILVVMYFLITWLASAAVAIPVCAPAMAACAAAAGCPELLPMACVVLTFAGGLGLSVQPYEPKVLYVSQMCQITPIQVVKRMSVPIAAGFVASIILSIVLYGL